MGEVRRRGGLMGRIVRRVDEKSIVEQRDAKIKNRKSNIEYRTSNIENLIISHSDWPSLPSIETRSSKVHPRSVALGTLRPWTASCHPNAHPPQSKPTNPTSPNLPSNHHPIIIHHRPSSPNHHPITVPHSSIPPKRRHIRTLPPPIGWEQPSLAPFPQAPGAIPHPTALVPVRIIAPAPLSAASVCVLWPLTVAALPPSSSLSFFPLLSSFTTFVFRFNHDNRLFPSGYPRSLSGMLLTASFL